MENTFKPKPIIEHTAGRLPQAVEETCDALANANIGLYRWCGNLAVLHHMEDGAVNLVSVTPQLIQELATRAAEHRRWDQRLNKGNGDWKITDCPMNVAKAVAARGHWPMIQELYGILEAPTITLDGRIIATPGYDLHTKYFCSYPKKLPDLPGVRGRAAAQLGLKNLKTLLRGFPFKTPADETAAVAAILLAVVRKVLPTAPMFGITAPTPGTGKTLLAEVVAIIATGRTPPVTSMGKDENEFSKRITGALLSGANILLIDNIVRDFGKEDFFNQITSSESMSIRPLGTTTNVTAKTNLTVIATGNNLTPIGDMRRRVILTRLDAKEAHPERRSFSWNVISEAKADRDKLLRSALEVIKFYVQAGKPEIAGFKPMGKFEAFDDLVRKPLMHLGEPDPLFPGVESLEESDPDLEAQRLMFYSMWQIYPEKNDPNNPDDKGGITSMTIKEDAEKKSFGDNNKYVYEGLREAIEIICYGKIEARRIGWWLRNHRDKIIDAMDGKDQISLQLVRSGYDGHLKASRWRVIKL